MKLSVGDKSLPFRIKWLTIILFIIMICNGGNTTEIEGCMGSSNYQRIYDGTLSAVLSFGSSVVECNSQVIVGASSQDNGSVYVFASDSNGADGSWALTQTIQDNPAVDSSFGFSLSCQGTYLFIGAPGDGTGKAYVYEWNGVGETWDLDETFTPGDGVADDEFGISLSADNDFLVIGSRYEGGSGAVYTWVRNTGTDVWDYVEKVKASDVTAGFEFGTVVDIDYPHVVVTDPLWEDSGYVGSEYFSGVVYMFEVNGVDDTLTERTIIESPEGVVDPPQDYFAYNGAVIYGEAVFSSRGVDSLGVSSAPKISMWKWNSGTSNWDYSSEETLASNGEGDILNVIDLELYANSQHIVAACKYASERGFISGLSYDTSSDTISDCTTLAPTDVTTLADYPTSVFLSETELITTAAYDTVSAATQPTFSRHCFDCDCNGVPSGPATLDCNGVCNGSGTLDCNGVCDGPAVNDCNGVCDGPSVLDCNGVCDGSGVLDCNGVCDGSGVLDCLGVCDGSAVNDCNGVCDGPATLDCNGVCDGPSINDCNGVCDGPGVLDCNGVCDGSGVLDCLGVCDGSAVLDCFGVCDGPAIVDLCGICDGDDSSCEDCNGVPNGSGEFDSCGVCDGDNSTCTDCNGIVNGLSELDCDGVCDGPAILDCDGVCNGPAVLDCNGTCNGLLEFDVCGVCDGDDSTCEDCAGVPNGPAELDCAGVCNGLAVPDICGICDGDGGDCSTILSATFMEKRIKAGKDLDFTAVGFIVDFSKDLYMSNTGVKIADLSLEVPDIEEAQDVDMPPAMIQQFGTSTLICPCFNCSGDPEDWQNYHPECDSGTECVYGSMPDITMMRRYIINKRGSVDGTIEDHNDGGGGGSPNFFLPFPAVDEPFSTLFTIFAGAEVTAEPVYNRYVAVKLIEEADYWSGETRSMVPSGIDWSTCTIEFSTQENSPSGSYITADPTGTEHISHLDVTGFEPEEPICDYIAMQALTVELFEEIEKLKNTGSKEGMQQISWTLAAIQAKEVWTGCDMLVNSLVIMGDKNITEKGSKWCNEEWNSPEWLEDPCCNWELEFTMCCTEKEIIRTVTGVVGINEAAILEQCIDSPFVVTLANDYVANTIKAEECSKISEDQGNDWQVWERLTSFTQTCNDEIYGDHQGPPECTIDEDCYTDCVEEEEQCIVPWNEPEGPLLECFVDNMNEKLERFLRRKWNLTGQSDDEQFAQEFRDRMQDDTCNGPEAWQHQGTWESQQVDSCQGENDTWADNCWCWTPYYYGDENLEDKDGEIEERWYHESPPHKLTVENHVIIEHQRQWFKPLVERIHYEKRGYVNTLAHVPPKDILRELLRLKLEWSTSIEWIQSAAWAFISGSNTNNPFLREDGTGGEGDGHGNSGEEICYQSVFIPPDPVACLEDKRCTWNPWGVETQEECESTEIRSEYYCAECHGNECWEVSSPDMCYSWMDPIECTNIGGVTGQWGDWHCVFPDITSAEECIQEEYCEPPYKHDWMGADYVTVEERWCNSKCVLTTITNSTECEGQFGDHGWLHWDNHVSEGDGYCNAGLWDQISCESQNDTLWIPQRNYMAGSFNTEERCNEGMCSMNMYMNSTQCENLHACTMPCEMCRPMNWGSTLCYTMSMNETECQNDIEQSGEWDYDYEICKFPNLNSRSLCEAESYIYESCEDLNKDQCVVCQQEGYDDQILKRDSGNSSCAVCQGILQCYYNQWDQCTTEESCESSGMCNDWEMENWNSPECWGDMGNKECRGVCIFPFDMTYGYRNCDWYNGQGWTQIGCADYNIVGEESCNTNNGTWHARAWTEDQCNSHGSGCLEKRHWGFSGKDQSECNSCSGDWNPFYTWKSGHWLSGHMKPLEWKARNASWVPINTWGPALNMTKFYNDVEGAVGNMFADNMKSEALCKYSKITNNLETLACACGDNPGTEEECFGISFIPTGEGEFFSGIDDSANWGNVQIHVNNDTISAEADTEEITASQVNDLDILVAEHNNLNNDNGNETTPEKRSFETPGEYDVVENNLGAIVGQLVGAGINLGVGELEGLLGLCIDIYGEIPIDTEGYTVPDFAIYNETAITWKPYGFPECIVENEARVCCDVSMGGYYFPIYRISEWETQEPCIHDECGICGGDNTSCAGCDNVPNSGLVLDGCEVCGGNNSTCAGCDGIPNSGLVNDDCGVCNGDNTACAGCDDVPNSGLVNDACGVCDGDNSTCTDCFGVVNGPAIEDVCGVCDGDTRTCVPYGCTYTARYWETHPDAEPTPFAVCNIPAGDILLHIDLAGDLWYTLAKQVIATYYNSWNSSTFFPNETALAFGAAMQILQSECETLSIPEDHELYQNVTVLYYVLRTYNHGSVTEIGSCPGDIGNCTRHLDYWKHNHAYHDLEDHRIPWPTSEDTEICGLKYLDIINTHEIDNAWLVLAKQTITALNNYRSTEPGNLVTISQILTALKILEDNCESGIHRTSAFRSPAFVMTRELFGYNMGQTTNPLCDDLGDGIIHGLVFRKRTEDSDGEEESEEESEEIDMCDGDWITCTNTTISDIIITIIGILCGLLVFTIPCIYISHKKFDNQQNRKIKK